MCRERVLCVFAPDVILMNIEFILMKKVMCTSLGLLFHLECSGCYPEVDESSGCRAGSGVKLGGVDGAPSLLSSVALGKLLNFSDPPPPGGENQAHLTEVSRGLS